MGPKGLWSSAPKGSGHRPKRLWAPKGFGHGPQRALVIAPKGLWLRAPKGLGHRPPRALVMGPKRRADTKTYWPSDRRSQIYLHSTQRLLLTPDVFTRHPHPQPQPHPHVFSVFAFDHSSRSL
jgi:hypothetical protein